MDQIRPLMRRQRIAQVSRLCLAIRAVAAQPRRRRHAFGGKLDLNASALAAEFQGIPLNHVIRLSLCAAHGQLAWQPYRANAPLGNIP